MHKHAPRHDKPSSRPSFSPSFRCLACGGLLPASHNFLLHGQWCRRCVDAWKKGCSDGLSL
jgi:hypothetical protein